MDTHLTAAESMSAGDLGEFVCSARATNVVPPFVWYLLSILTLTVGIPLMLSSASLLSASQPGQQSQYYP